jgi:hypothetical protein
VQEAADHPLQYDAHFIEAVEEGRAVVRRWDLREHDEVVERIERMFRP